MNVNILIFKFRNYINKHKRNNCNSKNKNYTWICNRTNNCFFSIFFCLFLIACNENSNKNSNKNSDSSKINKNVRNVLTIPVSKLPNYSINFAKNNELQNIVFDGIISPQIEYNAAFRVGGKIIQQDIKVGDILSANQILAN